MIKIDYKEKKFLNLQDQEQQDLDHMIEMSALKLQGAIATSKRDMKSLERELTSLKQTYPLDLTALCEAKQKLDAKERAVKFLTELKEELGLEIQG